MEQLDLRNNRTHELFCLLFVIVGVTWRLSLSLLIPPVFSTVLVSLKSVKIVSELP